MIYDSIIINQILKVLSKKDSEGRMVTFFQVIQILSGLITILLVLLHSPKGDGMASIGGAAQLFSSQKGIEEGLNKVTTAFAVIFIVVSILLGFGIVS